MTETLRLLRNSFYTFFVQVFLARNPNAELLDSPFQQYICNFYENLRAGDRVVVNQPPRTGKSLTLSAYALWCIGRDSTEKILFISNNIPLAEEHVYEARKIMNSDWYRHIFKGTRIAEDRSGLQHLQTTKGGGFFAKSMQSSLGGIGATKIFIDDGNRIDDASNYEHLERGNRKFDGEIFSRLNPAGKQKRRGVIINVQHRLAENDLSGHLIKEGFKCIAFPLEAPRAKTYHWADKTWTRAAGHVLLENYSERQLAKARELLDPPYFYFYQQAQGRNAAIEIRPTDFSLCDYRNSEGPFVMSIDAAQGETQSFNVAQVWDVGKRPLHLRTQVRNQDGFATFEIAVKRLITRYRPGAVLVENAANGPALVSHLRHKLPSANFVMVNPQGSKVMRLARHRKVISAGAISLQETESWLDDYISEFVRHPKLASDQVDATTQLLDWRPEDHEITPSGPFFSGPAGISGSTMQPLRHSGSIVSSKTRGIVRVHKKSFFK